MLSLLQYVLLDFDSLLQCLRTECFLESIEVFCDFSFKRSKFRSEREIVWIVICAV